VWQTKLGSSLVNVLVHYKIVIDCLIDRLIDQFLKVLFVDSDAPEVVAAGTGARLFSSLSSLLLLSRGGCKDSV